MTSTPRAASQPSFSSNCQPNYWVSLHVSGYRVLTRASLHTGSCVSHTSVAFPWETQGSLSCCQAGSCAPGWAGSSQGPLSAPYLLTLNVCGFKTRLRLSFIQGGFGIAVGRTVLSFPRVPSSLCFLPGFPVPGRGGDPSLLCRCREAEKL